MFKRSKEDIEEIICKALYKFSTGFQQDCIALKEENYYAFSEHVAAILNFEFDEEHLQDDFQDLVINE